MQLVQGATYRGRGIVSTPAGVNKNNAKEKLEGKGFTNVQVWLEPEELPADWPAKARSDESGWMSTQVWAEVTWGQATADMEDSGTGWKILDLWEVGQPGQVPGDPACGSEGYSCDASAQGGFSGCCVGQECRDDAGGVYGGGPRCQPRAANIQPLNSAGSWLWWTVGVVGLVAGGGTVAWYLWGRKHNPVDPKTRYKVVRLGATHKGHTVAGITHDPADASALAHRIRNEHNSHGAAVVREVLWNGKWHQG